ncbi:MAG: hypothetical protein A2945_03850 [Candidatus Liptonbacteria bacterium RIFCSPLOWO2_01_FULL_52_25]|uniref:Uncharacterized protein n=1 Tax=Candidatus Liptonbacteria bacterium RIFCSPLOWO2_01_FULL_52_25 TaxID=1798650 RepID=A0A1G2CJ64_9BACT|nr:MAG: hypothetical protein A2945_03850 [Candidatus Liptonbacteria bacterium RIFCSPLOWO2_01_FULL_52_25]
MPFRLGKQLAYLAVFILFWFGVVSLFYRTSIKPVPTCYDNIQNQREAGVDCGGPCATVCVPANVKPIELVGQVIRFSPDPTHFSLLARVNNPNTTHAARNFSYSFFLYDASEKLVKTYSGASYIYAGEAKYILLPNVPLPGVPFNTVDFKVESAGWLPKDTFIGPPFLTSSNVTSETEGNRITFSGQVTNKDTVSFPRVAVLAIFRGQFGQEAGASQTEIENLLPNGTLPFSVIHPSVPNLDIAGTRVFVYASRP